MLTLPLYKFDWRRFIKSKLFIKIMFWIPIFLVLVGLLYSNNSIRLAVLFIFLGLTYNELFIVMKRRKTKRVLMITYFVLFAFALMNFYFINSSSSPEQFIKLLITICFASVLADVTAFFMGNYLGRHKLPPELNDRKSWEGVAGQVIGALLGVLLVNAFIVPVSPLTLFLPIGIGSAIGDLANSYVKRRVDIKDWSNNIPGHGGFLDRLSSLAGSALFTFYFLRLTGTF